MRRFSLQFVLVTIGLLHRGGAVGTTDVVCNTTKLSWSFNLENKSPCQITANLGAVCGPSGDYHVNALQPVLNNYYTPSPAATHCECSTVTYNLAAACGLCQGGTYTSWLFWQENCTQISPGFFPFPIPPNTGVPQWAFLDPRASNNFNATAAQRVGDKPESTSSATPTDDINPPSSTSTGRAGSLPSKKTNAGLIAGGVVGCVVALALLSALVLVTLRRRYTSPINQTHCENRAPLTAASLHSPFRGKNLKPSPMRRQAYDPNDLSTFPASPPSFGEVQQVSGHMPSLSQNSSLLNLPLLPGRPGGYSGAAEI